MKRKEICGSDSCADRNDISILIFCGHIFCGQCGTCFMFHIRSLGFFLVVTCEKKLAILGSTFKKLVALAGSNIKSTMIVWHYTLYVYLKFI